MDNSNPKVDELLAGKSRWQEELQTLRVIALGCGLAEEIKWGNPCYTHEGKNIVLLHSFKEYCAVLFFKGALIADSSGMLVQQTENVQAARQARFTTLAEIKKARAVLKKLILAAIEVEKAGLSVAFKKVEEFTVVEEFELALKKSAALKKAFNALTPGRQRAYLLHFSSAKQSKTRLARIAKCSERILAGKGLTD